MLGRHWIPITRKPSCAASVTQRSFFLWTGQSSKTTSRWWDHNINRAQYERQLSALFYPFALSKHVPALLSTGAKTGPTGYWTPAVSVTSYVEINRIWDSPANKAGCGYIRLRPGNRGKILQWGQIFKKAPLWCSDNKVKEYVFGLHKWRSEIFPR